MRRTISAAVGGRRRGRALRLALSAVRPLVTVVEIGLVLSVGAGALLGTGAGYSLARLTALASTSASFTAGSWVIGTYYLHNNPSPATGNTATQVGLPMNGSAPVGGTLYLYDSCGAASTAGRSILRSSTGLADANACDYVNWLSAALPAPRTLSGTATAAIWSGTKGFANNKTGSLTAYLRDYNPGTASYTTIGSGTVTGSNWNSGGTWTQKTISLSIASYTAAAGHRLELRLMATSGVAAIDMMVAFDTTAYPSSVSLP